MNATKPFILITNDDGYQATGIRLLTEWLSAIASVVVVAPHTHRSGQSSAITVEHPISVDKVVDTKNLVVYSCSGTPVDCVKLAINRLCKRKPDLVVSGINQGGNSSTAIIYSGTMGAAMEGTICGIPAVGFSYLGATIDTDFSPLKPYVENIVETVLKKGLPDGVCLNVNFPESVSFKGIVWARQARGRWTEEFRVTRDEEGREVYQLVGDFVDLDKGACDTDEWALQNGYVSIVPSKIDMTAYEFLSEMNDWFTNNKK